MIGLVTRRRLDEAQKETERLRARVSELEARLDALPLEYEKLIAGERARADAAVSALLDRLAPPPAASQDAGSPASPIAAADILRTVAGGKRWMQERDRLYREALAREGEGRKDEEQARRDGALSDEERDEVRRAARELIDTHVNTGA